MNDPNTNISGQGHENSNDGAVAAAVAATAPDDPLSSFSSQQSKQQDHNQNNSHHHHHQQQQQQNQNQATDKCLTRLPWGAIKEKPNLGAQLTGLIQMINSGNGASVGSSGGGVGFLNEDIINVEKKKPGEYLMKLIVFNFAQIGSKKLEQIINGDKRVWTNEPAKNIHFYFKLDFRKTTTTKMSYSI